MPSLYSLLEVLLSYEVMEASKNTCPNRIALHSLLHPQHCLRSVGQNHGSL